jgi:hypothetical protein
MLKTAQTMQHCRAKVKAGKGRCIACCWLAGTPESYTLARDDAHSTACYVPAGVSYQQHHQHLSPDRLIGD